MKIRESGDNFLDSPLFIDQPLLITSLQEQPGTVIGHYKLLEKIGEGGMAVVYLAEQKEPISRKVALKIIKLGMDTKQVIARFEAERQALAMMDHTNIAKVLDAGATDTGRPYFVMELVTGVSITEYCDKNNLSTKERLNLFIQVCNAVQHAHQKGIIHRDLKPSNVMVTKRDGVPYPKVIDFGIAKATRQRLTEKTLFTRYAHVIGTPAYMSPEQADLSDSDVDTRSDIYSLGVLLYELLTGTTPFSEEELRKAGYLEMQRMIREKEPAKPSTRLTTLGETLTDVAKRHSATPDVLTKTIRGDLDWIVMKTLEKTRDRRYDTVSALTMDVERHLKDQPILARAPGTFYRLHKFFRRHQIQIIASVIVSVLAVTLLIVFLVGKFKQRLLEAQLSMRDRNSFSLALNSFWDGNLDAALVDLELLVDSEYVGSEARRRRDEILAGIWERVRSYTEKIEANPEDAQSYLLRAQQYYCLGEKDKMIADMEMYVNILSPLDETNPHNLWFRDFLIGLWQSTPTNLGQPVNSFAHDGMGGITPDGLELILDSDRSGWSFDIWVMKRSTTDHDWDTPQKLPDLNNSFWDGGASLSPDGLSLYFSSNRPSAYIEQGGHGPPNDRWVSKRRALGDPWGTPVMLAEPINSSFDEGPSSISADGLEFYISSDRPGGHGKLDLWVTKRSAVSEPWGDPVNLGPTVNSADLDFCQLIWADGLILFFTSDRPGGYGHRDIWVTIRKTKDDNWGTPVNLGPTINSSQQDQQPFIWADGYILYFASNKPGGYGGLDIWQVPISPISESPQEDSDDSVNTTIQNDDGKEE